VAEAILQSRAEKGFKVYKTCRKNPQIVSTGENISSKPKKEH
jgi:hypothetical protein